jgi:hypothetical protein
VCIFLQSGTLHDSRDAAFDVGLRGEQNTNAHAIMRCMPSRCRVSYADRHGLLHAIDVEAASLFEAVAIAVAIIKRNRVLQLLEK